MRRSQVQVLVGPPDSTRLINHIILNYFDWGRSMKKVDLKKKLKSLYNPPEEIVLVNISGMNFLMIDGAGNQTRHGNIKMR
jgi:hypothetical protein